MRPARLVTPGPFTLVEALHIDREVLAELLAWAEPRGLTLENAIQVAICLFNEHRAEWLDEAPPPPDLAAPRCVDPPPVALSPRP